MRSVRKGDQVLIKEINRVHVLDQLRLHGPLSRAEIAERTGLSFSAVVNITEHLMAEGLVFEAGPGASSGGRKPVLLKFNPKAACAVGIKVGKGEIDFCISDLDLTIERRLRLPFDPQIAPDPLRRLLIDGISEILTGRRTRRLAGIGVAVSGVVDQAARSVLYSPLLGWENYSLAELDTHFDAPVFVENDANVFAIAEHWTGKGAAYRNFVGVILGAGIGAGIMIDGQVYRGEFGGAGELGHTLFQPDGIPCYCGQRGCLEMYTSDLYVAAEAERLRTLGLLSPVDGRREFTIDAVHRLAAAGDRHARRILSDRGRNVGRALRSVVSLLNPAAIIFSQEAARDGGLFLAGVEEELSGNFFSRHGRKVAIHVSDLGSDAWLLGACSMVVRNLFRAPIYREDAREGVVLRS